MIKLKVKVMVVYFTLQGINDCTLIVFWNKFDKRNSGEKK
jgi:hypothetical protein